eukprot:2271902-Amphidinium_carterae.1
MRNDQQSCHDAFKEQGAGFQRQQPSVLSHKHWPRRADGSPAEQHPKRKSAPEFTIHRVLTHAYPQANRQQHFDAKSTTMLNKGWQH